MRLATIGVAGRLATAVVIGDGVIDLPAADNSIPADMPTLLAQGSRARAAIEQVVASTAPRIALSAVRLEAPVPNPRKFFAVGMNYAAHAAEGGAEVPEIPPVFAKLATAVVGPFDDVQLPRVSSSLDYEGELGIVIGRRCRHVPRDRATEVIAGYVVVNDLSVRDWQWRTPQWVVGKSFDTHGPFGPWIATPDELDGELSSHTLRTWVNGELRQESLLNKLVHDPFDLVAHLSQACTLEPGDIIATGTPSGVGAAFDPPRWLTVGDVVRVDIEGIGAIENRVVPEPETAWLAEAAAR